jgi:hypothetical protein
MSVDVLMRHRQSSLVIAAPAAFNGSLPVCCRSLLAAHKTIVIMLTHLSHLSFMALLRSWVLFSWLQGSLSLQ